MKNCIYSYYMNMFIIFVNQIGLLLLNKKGILFILFYALIFFSLFWYLHFLFINI